MADLPNITRRLLLRALPAVAALTAIPVAAAAESVADPDAYLLRLGAEFERRWAAQEALRMPADNYNEDDWKPYDAANDLVIEVIDQIEQCQAQTPAGIMIKARVVLWCHSGDFDGFGGDATDHRFGNQIIHDLLALAGYPQVQAGRAARAERPEPGAWFGDGWYETIEGDLRPVYKITREPKHDDGEERWFRISTGYAGQYEPADWFCPERDLPSLARRIAG